MKKILFILFFPLFVSAQYKDTIYKVPCDSIGRDTIHKTRVDSTIEHTTITVPGRCIRRFLGVFWCTAYLPPYSWDSLYYVRTTVSYDSIIISHNPSLCDSIVRIQLPPPVTNYIKGIFGLSHTTKNNPAFKAELPYLKGWRYRFQAANVNPAEGVYTWDDMEADISMMYEFKLPTIFSVMVAPHNPDDETKNNTPSYLFKTPYSVPLVKTSAGFQYPYYFNPAFITFKQDFLNTLFNRIKYVWPQGWRDNIYAVQSAEGTTGDWQAYQGTPTNPAYIIDDSVWDNYKRVSVWKQFDAQVHDALPNAKSFFNSWKNIDWSWYDENVPSAFRKLDQAAHVYNYRGERWYAEAANALADSVLTIGELENSQLSTWFSANGKQNLFATLFSFIASGGDIHTIQPTTLEALCAGDYSLLQMVNDVQGGNTAFVLLRDVIDVCDTVRFNTYDYGVLIDPNQQKRYDWQYKDIWAGTDDETTKHINTTGLIVRMVNPARITKLKAAFPSAKYITYSAGNYLDVDRYNSDIDYDMIPGNYKKGVVVKSENTTPYWRIGKDNFHGRFCKTGDILFETDTTYSTADVWYYDEANKFFTFTDFTSQTVETTGTNKWLHKTFFINRRTFELNTSAKVDFIYFKN